MPNELEIRECLSLTELEECVQLQRDVFGLPESELSPVRHFVVTKNAGGFVLGAFDGDIMAGFVLSVPAFLYGERAFYSHMAGVRRRYQSTGIGAKLKWAQRSHSLQEGVRFIKWTFEPVKARNAYFNLEKLGAEVREIMPNFYGTDYGISVPATRIGLASDRLFAEWHLESQKVEARASGQQFNPPGEPVASIAIMTDWPGLVEHDPEAAFEEQMRIRSEFEIAFANGYTARGFMRSVDGTAPTYLLYKD